MRKAICLMIALLLCVSMTLPVFAAKTSFVPSITYKDGPGTGDVILDDNGNRENVDDCVVVTSIGEAKKKSTDITQEERDELLDVYKKLSDGSMKLPLDDDYVIRELVDVSFEYQDCRQDESHGHKDQKLKEPGVTLEMDFDLGVGKKTDVKVLVYIDGKWQPIKSVKNNGDGTITCVFEDICPVAFVVDADYYDESPKTGDQIGQNLGLWVGILAASAAALVAVVVISRKKTR